MSTECNRFRTQIPASMLGDLSHDEQTALGRHLEDCAPCRKEQELYANTFGHLRSAGDADVPRHFFVYQDQARRSPWHVFRQMPLVWQGAVAAVALGAVALSVAALMHLQVRTAQGAFFIGFGALPETPAITAPTPALDPALLEARILRTVEEKNRVQAAEWIRTLRAEISSSNRALTRRQRAFLETALSSLESRVSDNIAASTAAVEARADKTVAGIYDAIATQRERDLTAIETRLNRLAVSGEMKSSQTDAILETLLEVAELRMSNLPGEK